MTYNELLKEFTSLVPIEVYDYRPLSGTETIIVWTTNGKSIIVKRIKEKTFEIKALETALIYTTTHQIGKNAKKVIYNHDKKNLCDSRCIWKITKDYVYFSDNGGLSWTIV